MTPGQLARRLLGPLFPLAGRAYRGFFVDLDEVVASVPPLPPGAEVLDIGGGDGMVVNRLLRRHPDARVTMIDLAASIGGALEADLAPRVRVLPRTSIRDYLAAPHPEPDVILVSDVLHHVPSRARRQFFVDLRDLVAGTRAAIFIKDVEPGSWRATASYLADRWISGDRQVELIGAASLTALLREVFPSAEVTPTDLVERDRPNYALVVRDRLSAPVD